MDNDSFLISYEPRELGLASLDDELGRAFSGVSAVAFRRWRGPESAYMAVSRLLLPEDIYRLTDRVGVGLHGAGRLVLDEGVPVVGPLPAIEDVLRPDPANDLWLPSVDIFAGSEVLVCPLCGGMNRHFDPPAH